MPFDLTLKLKNLHALNARGADLCKPHLNPFRGFIFGDSSTQRLLLIHDVLANPMVGKHLVSY